MPRPEHLLLSDEDRDLLQFNWWLVMGYPAGRIKGKFVYLHRIVLARKLQGIPKKLETDHINGNKLDNRRENLRATTSSLNKVNRPKRLGLTSPYIGVAYAGDLWRRVKRWRAYIKITGRQVTIGYFNSAEDAARARDQKARQVYGEFARLNYA